MPEGAITNEGAAGAPPAAGTPPAPTPPPPPAVAKPGVPAPATPVVETAPKRVRLSGADDDVPEDADLIEMSKGALASRLARASSKDLKRRFGTDDPDAIAKDLDELKTFRTEKEAQRVANLSEVEKERDLRTKAEQRATAAEAQAREAHEHRVFEREDRHLVRLSEKVIDADYVDAELARFAKHLNATYERKVLRKMSDAQRDKLLTEFLTERVKAKPKLAADYETKKADEIKEQLKKDAKLAGRKQPVTNGANAGDRPSDAGEGGDEKTFAPGKKNSMSDDEARRKMRENGISYR